MYRWGVLHVGVLLLVILVGSALAQGLTGTQLYVTGTGPNAIGGETNPRRQLNISGIFNPAPGGLAGVGIYLQTQINATVGDDAYGAWFMPSVLKAPSGTHTLVSSVRIDAPALGGSPATLANASALYIGGASSLAANNYALWVAGGTTRLGGKLQVNGDAQIDGNIAAKYQDVAEWVPTTHALTAATVAIIDSRAPNRVVTSDKPYDTHVAGVVSTRPGILLGESGADKTKLAHSGRVKVKVDASYGAVAIGDLLVTSATPGHAMRSEPVDIGGIEIHRPGTIIGKALESLQTGQGEILVLLTLQ